MTGGGAVTKGGAATAVDWRSRARRCPLECAELEYKASRIVSRAHKYNLERLTGG